MERKDLEEIKTTIEKLNKTTFNLYAQCFYLNKEDKKYAELYNCLASAHAYYAKAVQEIERLEEE